MGLIKGRPSAYTRLLSASRTERCGKGRGGNRLDDEAPHDSSLNADTRPQGGVSVKLRPTSAPVAEVAPVHLVDVHDPVRVPGKSCTTNCVPSGNVVPEHPPGPTIGPATEPVTLPDTLVGKMVPVTVPFIAHLSQATEYGIEKAPLLLTTVVPAAGAVHDRSGVTFSGTETASV